MCEVISISNQKGGCSKTVFSVNLAIGLARNGKRVLLIDNDPQGSASISLGFQQPDNMDITLATILGKVINDEEFSPFEGIQKHPEGISVLPGNIELAGLEVTMVNVISRELLLRRYIDMIRDEFDYVVIDNTPSLGMLSLNSLACADQVIIPCSAGYLPARGLEELINVFIPELWRCVFRLSMMERILDLKFRIKKNYG